MAESTFLFYDLETSGLSAKYSRVMQFAGVRTDMNFKQIGEPMNILVKLPEDVLPSPSAVVITGITPQQTLAEGISEAEFAKLLQEEVFTPGTITVGYNNIRFDDEFLRNVFWRNFHDPYEWQWSEDRSRWDLLDVVRLVRALRPDNIKWPIVEKDGVKVPTNRLELLSKENGLVHEKAHDALSDVRALIAVTKLLKDKQPKIFDFLFKHRGKKEVARLVNLDDPQPFVYASGRYSAEHEKTTVAFPIAPGKNAGTVLVYDLTQDIMEYERFSDEELQKCLTLRRDEREEAGLPLLPIKELNYGRSPAVAPLGVLDEDSQKRLGLNLDGILDNYQKLLKNRGLVDKLVNTWKERPDYIKDKDVEGQLYEGFLSDADKAMVRKITMLNKNELADFHPSFADERMGELLFRYKARNFPKSLNETEQKKWQEYRVNKFTAQIDRYIKELYGLAEDGADDFLLQELQLWAEAVYPGADL